MPFRPPADDYLYWLIDSVVFDMPAIIVSAWDNADRERMKLESDKDFLLEFAMGHVYEAYIEYLVSGGHSVNDEMKSGIMDVIYHEGADIRQAVDTAG